MINEKEAPRGYKATKGMCPDCAFCALKIDDCAKIPCASWERDDGEEVILVKK